MKTEEILKKYSNDLEHTKRVSRLSILLFEKIKNIFLKLQNFDNKDDLSILETGARLHDIGIFFEGAYDKPHNKAGAKFILENKPDDIKEEDLKIIASIIRYHRKSFPKDCHGLYSSLSQKQKSKVDTFSAIVRLADSMDFMHLGLVENFEIEYDKNFNILTIVLGGNIMLNKPLIDAMMRKKDLFECIFKTKVNFR